MGSASRNRREGLFVFRFAGLIVAWLVLSALLARLIGYMGGPRDLTLTLAPGDPLRYGGQILVRIPFAESLAIAAFCLALARDVGYHCRDARWAALPSPVAPYFIFKIGWRVANLPRNRYWEQPLGTRDERILV